MAGARYRPWLWLTLIVVGGVTLRLYGVTQLRWNVDEGFWTYGSSMAIHHGVWWPERWRQGFLSPVYTRLLYPFFWAFGASIPVARYLSVATGMAAVPLTYLLCLRCGYRPRVALLGALLLSLNGYFAFMNAHAQTDSLLVLLVLSYFLLASGSTRERQLAPALLALAMLTKLTGLFAAPVMYLHDAFVASRQSPASRRWLLSAMAPAAGVLLAGFVFVTVYATHPAAFLATWKTELLIRKAQSPIGFNPMAAEGLVASAKFLGKAMPLTLLLGLAAIVAMIRDRSEKHVLPLLWLAFGVLVVAFQNYQPPRFYLPIIPPLSIMAAWLLDEWLRSAGRRGLRWVGASAVVLMCLYGPASLYLYAGGHRDTTGPDITRWMRDHLTADTGVMGISPYGCSAHVRYYPQDLYAPDTFLDSEGAARLHIDYILLDDAEWRRYSEQRGSGFVRYVHGHYHFVKRVGTVEIWKTGVAGGGAGGRSSQDHRRGVGDTKTQV